MIQTKKQISIKWYVAALIIACVGFLAYSNSFHAEFHFDDEEYILNYTPIHDIKNAIPSIWKTRNDRTRLVAFFSLALNYHLHQTNVFGYHVVNFLIHIINAFCIWWFVQLLFRTPRMRDDPLINSSSFIAFFAALLFVAHPIQTQAVTYIVQRFASLATMFYLLCVCFYMTARTTQKGKLFIYGMVGLSILSAATGMLTKEITYTIPFSIIALELLFFKRKKEELIGFVKKFGLPFLIFCIFVLYIWKLDFDFVFHSRKSQSRTGEIYTNWEYFLTQFRVLSVYIKLIFLPVGQNLDYDFMASRGLFKPITTFLGLMFLLSIFVFAYKIRRKNFLVTYGIFWFFLTISIESSIIAIQNLIFEHRVYLPFTGASIALAAAMAGVVRNKTFQAAFATVCIVILSILTYKRNAVWRTELSLWSDVVVKTPNKARVHNNLGKAYFGIKDKSRAMYHLSKAIEFDKAFYAAYINRGLLYDKLGRHEEALKDYDQALMIRPDFIPTLNNRGLLYIQEKKFDLALKDFFKCIEQNPRFYEGYKNIADAYFLQGNHTQALKYFNAVINLKPDFADAYNNRGLLHYQLGKYEKALEDFNAALNIKREYLESFNNRAVTHSKLGNYPQAILDYNAAIKIDPKGYKTYANRASTLALMGQQQSALEDFNKSIALGPDYEKTYLQRANHLAQMERFKEALLDYNEYIRRDPSNPSAYYNRSLVYNSLGDKVKAMEDVVRAQALGKKIERRYIEHLNNVPSKN